MQADGIEGLLAAEVKNGGASFEAGEVRMLFRANLGLGYQGLTYSATKDSQRFVVMTSAAQSLSPLLLVGNWTAELNKK
jgi:hypothetical protein